MYKTGREASFLKSLKSGKQISRGQAACRFNLANPSAAVLRMEEAGVAIQRSYVRRKADGVYIVKYSMKAPKVTSTKKSK